MMRCFGQGAASSSKFPSPIWKFDLKKIQKIDLKKKRKKDDEELKTNLTGRCEQRAMPTVTPANQVILIKFCVLILNHFYCGQKLKPVAQKSISNFFKATTDLSKETETAKSIESLHGASLMKTGTKISKEISEKSKGQSSSMWAFNF